MTKVIHFPFTDHSFFIFFRIGLTAIIIQIISINYTEMKDKTELVTGVASGIGKATAILFAKRVASVIVSDILEAEVGLVAAGIWCAGKNAAFFRPTFPYCKTCRPCKFYNHYTWSS